MDALLISFVAGLLAEIGARTQNACHAFAGSATGRQNTLKALFAVTVISLIVSAIGGVLVAKVMNPDAALLMLGLALGFAGLGQLRLIKPAPAPPETPSLLATALRIGAGHMQDGTPFLVFAVAARSGDVVLPVAGGLAAVMALCLPSILIPLDWHRPALFVRLRRIGGAILIVAGIWCALAALKLI